MRCPECGHVIRTEEKACPRCQWVKDGKTSGGRPGIWLPVSIALAFGLLIGGGGTYYFSRQRAANQAPPTVDKNARRSTPLPPGLADTARPPMKTIPPSALPPSMKLPDMNRGKTLPPVIPQTNAMKPPVMTPPKNLPKPIAMYLAAEKGEKAKVQKLLGEDKNLVAAKGEFDLTPLHMAARAGKKDVVDVLLQNGAAVDTTSTGGYTPLHLAALHGFTDIATALAAKGADINARDGDGKTPQQLAASEGHVKTITFLLDKGADINAKDKIGSTPLHEATIKHHPEAAKLLKGRGATE